MARTRDPIGKRAALAADKVEAPPNAGGEPNAKPPPPKPAGCAVAPKAPDGDDDAVPLKFNLAVVGASVGAGAVAKLELEAMVEVPADGRDCAHKKWQWLSGDGPCRILHNDGGKEKTRVRTDSDTASMWSNICVRIILFGFSAGPKST